MILGVNIDHVATVRQARGGVEPDPLEAAYGVKAAGAHGLTVHLRMDRRHIQESDIRRISEAKLLPVNIEMAATDEMRTIAAEVAPSKVTLVPELPGEVTTTGGLDCFASPDAIREFVRMGRERGITIAVFIDPDRRQIEQASALGIGEIEIHTGEYADHHPCADEQLEQIAGAAAFAAGLGMRVAAGHGLKTNNVGPVAAIREVEELNIGHHLIARAVFVGLESAIREMLDAIRAARRT